MVPSGTLLDPANPQLLDATGVHSEGYNRRFAVIDEEVDKIYGTKIREYFTTKNIELTACVLKGGEQDKRPEVSMIVVWNVIFDNNKQVFDLTLFFFFE